MNRKIEEYLADVRPPTPCLIIDLDVVVGNFRALQRVLPFAQIFYAVKANPAPEIVKTLSELGSGFDVASPGEIDICLGQGVPAERLSYANTIKTDSAIRYAYEQGVRRFSFDSAEELGKLATAAPKSRVFCRLRTSAAGADFPLALKFGCDQPTARELLLLVAERGLTPDGIAFHVGSQQRNPSRWADAIASTAELYADLARSGLTLPAIDMGGGFPIRYRDDVPPLGTCAQAIREAMDKGFGSAWPEVLIEPGRYIVGSAGILHTAIVLIARKSAFEDRRWVFLDAGACNGLITAATGRTFYALRTPCDGGPTGPAVLAGPTCSDIDVLYEGADCPLPLDLKIGDCLQFLSAGAYTAALSMASFNGFPPLPTYCI